MRAQFTQSNPLLSHTQGAMLKILDMENYQVERDETLVSLKFMTLHNVDSSGKSYLTRSLDLTCCHIHIPFRSFGSCKKRSNFDASLCETCHPS